MIQDIRELNVLQASDASFIVRDSLPGGAPVIRTYREFPQLIKGLEEAFFNPPQTAAPQPAQVQ